MEQFITQLLQLIKEGRVEDEIDFLKRRLSDNLEECSKISQFFELPFDIFSSIIITSDCQTFSCFQSILSTVLSISEQEGFSLFTLIKEKNTSFQENHDLILLFKSIPILSKPSQLFEKSIKSDIASEESINSVEVEIEKIQEQIFELQNLKPTDQDLFEVCQSSNFLDLIILYSQSCDLFQIKIFFYHKKMIFQECFFFFKTALHFACEKGFLPLANS
jgi:hypothetical protein